MGDIRVSNTVAALAEVIWSKLLDANREPGQEPSAADTRYLSRDEQERLAADSPWLGRIAQHVRCHTTGPLRTNDVFDAASKRLGDAVLRASFEEGHAGHGTLSAQAVELLPNDEVGELVREAAGRVEQLAVDANLSAYGRRLLGKILRDLTGRADATYYLTYLDLLLRTPDAPASGAPRSVRSLQLNELRRSVAKARRASDRAGHDARSEERAIADGPRPLRKLVPRELQRPGEYLRVDRVDESDLRVHIKVYLRGARPVVSQVKQLEDAIEKHVRIPGFVVDLEFVDKPGRDVYEVDANPDEWPTNYNWVGTAEQLGHELFHLFGLDDEYPGEDQAGNAYLDMETRLAYLLWAIQKGSPPADANRGIMTDATNKPLPRHARMAVGLDPVLA